MAKEICISTTPHETRLAILEDEQLAEIYYERENEYTLAGSIYKGRVTRVLPGMQSSFVDVGLERDAFLYVTDFLEEQEDSEEFGGESTRRPRPGPPQGEEPEGRNDARGGSDRSATERNGGDRGRRPAASPEAAREGGRAARAGLRDQATPPTEQDLAAKEGGDSLTGTRRWRGRRGRRRGVRGNLTEGSQPADASSAEASGETFLDEAGEPEAFATPERGAPGGIAEIHASPATQAELESFAPATAWRSNEGGDASRGRSRGDQGSRGRREPYAQASTFERPRPSAEAPSGQAPAAGGAIVLPGESLSKYGSTSTAASAEPPTATAPRPAQRPVNYVAPKPSTLVEVSGGWDGGAVLPGEKLSRYRGASHTETLAAAGEFCAPTHDPAAPAQETIEAGPSETGLDQVDADAGPLSTPDLAEPELVAEAIPPAGDAGEPHAVHPSWHLKDGERPNELEKAAHSSPPETEEHPGEPAEYEPEHASVSYRVPPSGSSALRLPSLEAGSETELAGGFHPQSPSAVVDAEPVGELLDHRAAGPGPQAEQHDRAEAAQPAHSSASEVFPALSGELAHEPLHEPAGQSTGESARQPARDDLAAHTASEPETGRALSILHQDGTIETLPAETTEAPLEAERLDAGFDEHSASEADLDVDSPALTPEARMHQQDADRAIAATPFAELVDRLQGFAPGHGLLEEEIIDEEEYDFETLHAHHGDEHDHEDLEEETLEQQIGSAVLSDAIRDSHLDSRLGSNPEAGQQFAESADTHAGVDWHHSAGSELGLEEVDEEEDEEPAASAPSEEPRRSSRSSDDRGRGRGRGGARNGGRGRGRSAQTLDLPVISDMLKQGQEILVQIAKEPIAKKGARITSHIALPGRFLVFMPTVSHVGVSRKIASDEERLRLKRILISEKGESSGGFIVRTAADGASEEDLRADLRFLIALWSEIKQRSDSAKAPALIYHDLNLVERILRDQVSSNFSTIWVDSEAEYERIIRFLNRFQPSLVRRVKLYTKETPLFEHFGIQEEISKALKSKVWLKSGGSIVINQTEALVAIDINTGKYVGKTARLEDTIVKTNLDAIPEIVRQIRLRDLGGIIVIDFIDMDERKNRNRVLAALEEELKNDRAPSKVLQFNDFGLVAITRKRVKQSLERTLSVQCETCTGTGMVKSPVTVCNEIYIEMRKMQKTLDGKDVMLRVHPEVVKQLKLGNGKWINELEEMIAKTIIIKSDPALHPEQFDIH